MSVKQQFTEEEIYKDRDSQISAIEKTFEDAQKSVSELITGLLKSLLLHCHSAQQGPVCKNQMPVCSLDQITIVVWVSVCVVS